ncbi:hypothetical protein [Zhenpiania hominis]|uniref:hypothetical protein n=1 Tax=Zhenpiania hominis TaxID=2763644 RepID=UPI0039F46145
MKKILAISLTVILCLGFAACGSSDGGGGESEEPKEVSITDCVDNYEVVGVEDGVIYWDVNFNEEFNNQTFDGLDFYDCIKECFSRDESKTDGITDYSIHGTDNNGMLRFAWGYTCEDYRIVHEYKEDGTAEKHNYSLTDEMYQELLDILEK